MPEFDPLANLGPKNPKTQKDTLTVTLTAGDCITNSDYKDLTGNARRFLWRPPEDYIKAASGTVYSDSRGHILRYSGHKVTFINKSGINLRVKCNVPIGRILEPEKIYSRVAQRDENLAPRGSVKTVSRTKSKTKKKDVFSRATDRFSLDFRAQKFFSKDPNQSTSFAERVPGDDSLTPSYYATAYALADFIVIIPTDSQYTGEPLPADQEVIDILLTVFYSVTDTNPADGAKVESIDPIYFAALDTLGAMEYVDYYDFSTTSLTTNLVSPHYIDIPKLYPNVGLHNVGQSDRGDVKGSVGGLYYYHEGKPVSPVRMRSLETMTSRLQVNINAVEWPGSKTGFSPGFYHTLLGSLEFGFSAEYGCWVVVDDEGQPKILAGIDDYDKLKVLSVYAPVLHYSLPGWHKAKYFNEKFIINKARKYEVMVGGVKKTIRFEHLNYHQKMHLYHNLRYSVTFDQISSVLTATIKGLTVLRGVVGLISTLFL